MTATSLGLRRSRLSLTNFYFEDVIDSRRIIDTRGRLRSLGGLTRSKKIKVKFA